MDEHQYKHALEHARRLEFRIRDVLDDKSHHISQELLSESRRLVDELEVKKNPRSLEDRIKHIMRTLHHAKEYNQIVMDSVHIEELHKSFEHFMMELRKFDNY